MSYTVKAAKLDEHGNILTEAVSEEVARVLDAWCERHHEELVEALAPYGIHPWDISAPEWRQIIPAD